MSQLVWIKAVCHLVFEVSIYRNFYDVAVIQWITSCHTNHDHTCNNTLMQRLNITDNVCVNTVYSY